MLAPASSSQSFAQGCSDLDCDFQFKSIGVANHELMDQSLRGNRVIEVRNANDAKAIVCLKLDRPRVLRDAVDQWNFLSCQHRHQLNHVLRVILSCQCAASSISSSDKS